MTYTMICMICTTCMQWLTSPTSHKHFGQKPLPLQGRAPYTEINVETTPDKD